MSIYLYIRCEECNEDSDVIGRNTEHDDGLEDSVGIVKWRLYFPDAARFLVKHKSHTVRLISEFEKYPEDPPWSGNLDE